MMDANDDSNDSDVKRQAPSSPILGARKGSDCCFSHCEKHSCGKFRFFWWKSRFHCAVNGAFTLIVITLLFAVIVPPVIMRLEQDGIAQEVVIDSRSAPNFDTWQSNYYGKGKKKDVNYDLYIFHVANPVEALNGSKPVLVQMGPYAFQQYYNKFDIKWTHDGDRVQYRLQTFYIFNQDRTGAGLNIDDQLTIPYVSALGFEYLLQQIPIEVEDMLDAAVTTIIDTKLEEIEDTIEQLEQAVIDNPFTPEEQKNSTLATLAALDALLEVVRVGLDDYFEEAPAASTLFKLILCNIDSLFGTTLFWHTDPVSAYFGWLNDPLKMEVQLLIDALNLTDEVPWDTSNPGSATNYTSEYDATRRRDINIQKTGKTNLKDIGQYVVANNQTTQYVCVEPMDSQNESQYTEGEEFPWCEPFQLEWNKSTAYDKGYVLVFATDYANRIQGTDGNMFGAPADSEKMLMYINDIYRTAYSIYQKDTTDWHGIRLRRYGVQNKDSENSTMNPTEGWQYYNFAPSGMQNVTQVATLPLFISKPHFLDGDPSLAGSVKGLSPTREIHDTYIDIEPNTGALCRVHNRVQVNYQVNNYNLPEASAELVIAVEELCSGLADNNATCAELDDMTRCLAMPSDWRLHNDRVYIPYAWIHQYNEGSNDDATAIKDGLYVLDNFADDIQFWCYVSAGFLGLFITGMYTAKYIFNYEKAEEEHVPFHPSEALD